jgi:hypothetical protein
MMSDFRRTLFSTTLLLMGLSGLVGCSAQKSSEDAQSAPPKKVPPLHSFLPLKDRTVSSFEVTTDLGDKGILVLEIFRPRPELAELKIAGRVQRLTVEDNRISQATGGILLETPLEEGHSFKGSFGTVVIQKMDQVIEVPAGTYGGCLTTVEESTTPPKRSTSIYCPGIGLVAMTVESFDAEGPGEVSTRLTHHGPRVEIPQRHDPSN